MIFRLMKPMKMWADNTCRRMQVTEKATKLVVEDEAALKAAKRIVRIEEELAGNEHLKTVFKRIRKEIAE